MIKKNLLVLFLFFVLPQFNFGQKQINLKGKIDYCNKPFYGTFEIMINVVTNDTVKRTVFPDRLGNFSLPSSVGPDLEKIRFSYYGLILQPLETRIDTANTTSFSYDKVYTVCFKPIPEVTRDSLMKAWNKNIETILYWGYPRYSDREVFIFSRKYGVQYESQGCLGGDGEEEINAPAYARLKKRLGENWEENLWEEMREFHKSKK